MVCSPARTAANAQNSAIKSAEAREKARLEALEGLTGSGIALPCEDPAVISRRREALFRELNPKSEVGRMLVGRVAYLGVRLDRCQRYDAAKYSQRVRFAEDSYRDARYAQIDLHAKEFDEHPRYACRLLLAMPEGVDWMVFHLRKLRDDLVNEDRQVWSHSHACQLLRFLGLEPNKEARKCRITVLTEVVQGYFFHVGPGDAPGLGDDEKPAWARGELLTIIDNEISRIQEVRATLDHEKFRQDREEAVERMLFDPSAESTLARKYEAATERSLYRALRELKELDDWLDVPDVDEDFEPEASVEPEVVPEVESKSRGSLGSSLIKALTPVEVEEARPTFPNPGGQKLSSRGETGRFGTLPVELPPANE